MSRIPFADYMALPGLNASTLAKVDVSPLECRHYVTHGGTDSPAMAKGRLVHTAVLEPELLARDVVVYPDRRAGKAWAAFQAAHADRTIVNAKEYAEATDIAAAVRADPVAQRYLSAPGDAEVTLQWVTDGTACKGRLDWLTADTAVDLKTTKDPSPRGFGRQVANLNYHVRHAWYDMGLRAMGREVKHVLIAVQSAAPYDVVVYHMGAEVLAEGHSKARRLLARYLDCERTGKWPGVAGGAECELELPPWAFETADEPVTFSIGGCDVAV